jgi:hypothetical protein
MASQAEINADATNFDAKIENANRETNARINEYQMQSQRDHERNTLLFIAAFRELYRLDPEAKRRIQSFMDELLLADDDPEFTSNVVKDAQEILKSC